jgi:hypothetical protein
MKRALFMLMIGLVFLSSCTDDKKTDNTEVSLQFVPVYGESPLTMFTRSYPYRDGMKVKLQNFLFYVSDITLIANDGTEQLLSEVALVSFKEIQDDAAAARGYLTDKIKIPAGTYKGLRMGIGIAPSLNATQPGDYRAGHPLTDNYWSWALGYIFTKIEGNADLNGDNNYDENAKLTFHIGANALYQTRTFDINLVVADGAHQEIGLTVDLEKVLVDEAGNYLDFRVVRQDHTNDMAVARFIMDNLARSISLR